jgi:hypothetical protein
MGRPPPDSWASHGHAGASQGQITGLTSYASGFTCLMTGQNGRSVPHVHVFFRRFVRGHLRSNICREVRRANGAAIAEAPDGSRLLCLEGGVIKLAVLVFVVSEREAEIMIHTDPSSYPRLNNLHLNNLRLDYLHLKNLRLTDLHLNNPRLNNLQPNNVHMNNLHLNN